MRECLAVVGNGSPRLPSVLVVTAAEAGVLLSSLDREGQGWGGGLSAGRQLSELARLCWR